MANNILSAEQLLLLNYRPCTSYKRQNDPVPVAMQLVTIETVKVLTLVVS